MRKYITIIVLLFISLAEIYPYSYTDEKKLAAMYLERARFLYESSDYDSLPFYYHSAGNMFERFEQYEAAAECKLGMVDYHRMLNQQSAASESLGSAEQFISSSIGRESESWADALYVRAKLYTSRNRNRDAIPLLDSSLVLRQKLDLDPDGSARIYSVLGSAYFKLGDNDNAELNYRKAFDTYMKISEEPSMEKGVLLFNLGLVYSRRDDQEKWAEYTMQGMENNISLYGPDYPDLAENYNSFSSYYISRGRLDSARHYLNEAERILTNSFGNEYYGISRIYINKAIIHRYKGDYKTSLEYYLQAIWILEKQEIPDRSLLNVAYINLGNLYSSIREYQNAFDYFNRLLDSEGIVHPTRMARFYSYLSEIHIKLGNYSEAEAYLKKTFHIRQNYPSSNKIESLYNYQVYAALLDSTGRSSQATQYFEKALEVALQVYDTYHYRTARIYKQLGDHYERNNAFTLALDNYQKSIHALVPEYDMEEVEVNPPPDEMANLLFYLQVLKQKAEVLENMARNSVQKENTLKHYHGALSAYKTSIDVIGMLRISYLNDESKLYLSDNERSTYERCVETAFECYELSAETGFIEEAFIIAEKAKYATLQSALHREEALNLSGIPDSVREIESGMKQQLAVYQALLIEIQEDTLPDQVELQQCQSDLFRLKDQIAGLYRSLELDFPEYFNLLYSQEVKDAKDIGKSLGARDKLIEYFLASGSIYIFEISRKEFNCRRLVMDGSFQHDLDIVKRYIGGNSIRDSIQDNHAVFIESSIRLNNILVRDMEQFRNLIIIPEGVLSYFPFDVLITEPVPDFSGLYSEVPFLINSHSLRYGYNASLLYQKKTRNPGNMSSFVGFAPGYLSDPDEIAHSYSNRELAIQRPLLEALPGSIKEVLEIGEMLGGEAFVESKASESQFKSIAGNSHILHLATHAFLDDNDPLQSTLVFSENQQGDEDGFLKVYELYNMSLKARMVVLSACNTGMGELRSGEGIMSLARAFFYAGVPNIVMTLWTISDRQSYELMISFYRHLSKGRKAEYALRKAKLEFLENANSQYQHPKYWAGYILVGDPEHLFFPIFYRKLLGIAVISLILFVVLIAGRKYLRKVK